jgi:hypothetical protein
LVEGLKKRFCGERGRTMDWNIPERFGLILRCHVFFT